MPTDITLEQRLEALYAVPVPTELDRRIGSMITAPPVRRSLPIRPRMVAALAVAVVVLTAAAGPAVEWFQNWNKPFDRLWELAAPVDQTVTADGYRVTVHRAYVDQLGVRLAITVDDKENRWSEFYVDGAEVTDSTGRTYEGWNWSGARTPVAGSSATWSRFLLPAGVDGDLLKLRLRVTSLAVRAPEPVPSDPDPASIWTSVSGDWSFDFNVPMTQDGPTVSPKASATANGVTIDLEGLGLVPSGTIVRFGVEGLPMPSSGTLEGWRPVTRIEHDGEPLTDDPLPPGIVGEGGSVTLEAVPVVEELAGHWRITIFEFNSFDPAGPTFGKHEGPWILEFDVAEGP